MAKGGIKLKSFMGSRYTRVSQNASQQALQAQYKASMNDLLENLAEFIAEVRGMVPGVLVDALEPTLGKAMEYCPQDTGALRDSAYLEEEVSRGNAVVAIGFGKGGQPGYAIYVHELPYKHEAPTRSKFLQAAIDEDYYTILNAVPRLIRERAGT